MVRRIRLLLDDSAWFVPFLYGMGGIILTAFTQVFGEFFRDLLPEFIYLDLDSAASVLSSTFTSLMTMMTFSFSTILVVLTTYSSQFSPRTINNFLTNTSAKHTLGLFIMTTVYGISNLFLVRTADEGVVLSSGISVLLVIGSIWAFVKFIQTVSVSIQAERLLSELHKEALSVISEQKDVIESDEVHLVLPRAVHSLEGQAVRAPQTGYIRLFLREKQGDHETDFESVVAVGDFVAKGDLLGFWKGEDAPDIELFEIGEVRSSMQDPSFAIEKLSEIALRGISPGINDPNTAIHAIHYIGDILRELCELPDGDFLYSNGKCDWHVKRKTLETILFESLAPMQTYASRDIFVMGSVFEAIRMARLQAHETLDSTFEDMIQYFVDVIDWDRLHVKEQNYLHNKINRAKKMAT
ncbi:DUF2254 domain-containing protein [Exiguobacterium profundum]|uniref:DUF2254 domain-containing protein n=1 Tax=Exiguobacterium profundum TaxID=307643 RepID=UPI0029C44566|nr:DUF2254 domain-containing protein [Exiguobacterium profundum]MDX5981074.1 DUF2254 domain-containing protein [Exiguobacterium profundum]